MLNPIMHCIGKLYFRFPEDGSFFAKVIYKMDRDLLLRNEEL